MKTHIKVTGLVITWVSLDPKQDGWTGSSIVLCSTKFNYINNNQLQYLLIGNPNTQHQILINKNANRSWTGLLIYKDQWDPGCLHVI